MKIAMLSEGWEPLIGGGQLYAKYLSENLISKHDCYVDIFTRSFVGEDNKIYKEKKNQLSKQRIFRIGPITKFFNLFGRLGRLMNVSFSLYRLAKKEKYDIIHAHALSPGLPAKIIGGMLKIPVVYTVHGTMHMDTDKKGLLYWGEKFFVTKLKYDLEISVSSKILNYKNINKNIQIIYPGLNIDKFKAVNGVKKYKGKQFLFVGRLDWQKGLEYLIEALKIIGKETLEKNEFILNIVGIGELMNDLKQLIKKYGLEKFIIFKGKLLDKELVEEYEKNSFFVLPSLAEGQPIVVFEAFASKMPVIVTNVGDNSNFVKNNKNGFIVNPLDSSELAKAILNMLSLKEDNINNMIENGYNLVQEYDRDKVTNRIYEQYKLLLNNKY
ncbi:glycosyltransferase family 4 protein [Candidatus Gracilibacteria bacterium]|nr:glycosyltransferase family 4 protein [Candidatus Gracilibacteria bacterium]